jgi:hypothetical protein
VAQVTIAARWCIGLGNKGILYLGARGRQEAPKRQFRWAVWLRLRSAVRERARQAAYSGHGTHGALNDLDAPLT